LFNNVFVSVVKQLFKFGLIQSQAIKVLYTHMNLLYITIPRWLSNKVETCWNSEGVNRETDKVFVELGIYTLK